MKYLFVKKLFNFLVHLVLMFFSPYLLQMAETKKKMLRVKVVCLEVLYHPSNFLPSLKKRPVEQNQIFESKDSDSNIFKSESNDFVN